ncbi:MAG: hypothetical protein MUC85_00055 [Anaerolineales bacterium]|jgi:mannose-6-phosphate isomerase|nr:hypothetical protein [Anaerolineales bacterium]
MNQPILKKPIQLIPEYKDYVWGGTRLRPGTSPTAEAWVVSEGSLISTGLFAGKTLSELAERYPLALLGERVMASAGTRFPLLIKLLDSADWLSLQVHPNDEQASRLEGPGQLGKTEAWHVVEANPGARIIAGFQSGVSGEAVQDAIRQGNLLDYTQSLVVHGGETLFIPPGTLHSIGPGLLLYEVQQSSNLTYRVYDWGRPQVGGRVLHIEKSLEVVDPTLHPHMIPPPLLEDGSRQVLISNRYFTLEMLSAETHSLNLDTQGLSFHAITVIQGSAAIMTDAGSLNLQRFESTLIPANCGIYTISALESSFRCLLAYVS